MSNFQRGYGEYRDTDGPTIGARFNSLPPDCPVRLTVPLKEANEQASDAYRSGFVAGAVVGAALIVGGLIAVAVMA